MDVSLATHRATRWQATPGLPRYLTATTAATGTLALLLLGLLMLARRGAGALEHPLSTLGLLAATFVLAGTCQFLHVLWRGLRLPRRVAVVASIAVSAGFLATALALSLPGSPQAPLALLWAVLVAGEGTALLVASGDRPAAPARLKPRTSAPQLSSPGELAAPTWDDGLLPPGVTQRTTRAIEAETGEVIHGTVRETFAPGQRTANVHLAFCPPLAVTPELTCEQIEGPEATVKVGELEPYGARFDLRLKRASQEPVEVVLEWSAIAPLVGG